jgi:hypothetical protein
MVEEARKLHPTLVFATQRAENLDLGDQTFDYVILSDVLSVLADIQTALSRIRKHCHPKTRLIMNFHSRVWQGPLSLARSIGLKSPSPVINWVTPEDVHNLLYLAGFEVVRNDATILCPLPIPAIGRVMDSVLARLPIFRLLALTNWVVARPAPIPVDRHLRVSIIVPARNEAGNIEAVVRRTPCLGASTEVILVEGGSSDDTAQAIVHVVKSYKGPLEIKYVSQGEGRGKGDAVRRGFAMATGDVLMILDADLSVEPEALGRFYEALTSGRAEFVNGSRLVYPMEAGAMQFLNAAANRAFGWILSWTIGQEVRDTLCGTKVLSRTDYLRIVGGRQYFGDFDPFGDFDLIYGAAKLGLRLVDLPVRYKARTYGETNIQRFRHGWMLLRMAAFAVRRLKCH